MSEYYLKSWEMKNLLIILNKVNSKQELTMKDIDNLHYSIERLESIIPLQDINEKYELFKDFDELFSDNGKEKYSTETSRKINYLHKLGVPIEIKKTNLYESDNFSAIVTSKHKMSKFN